MEIDFYFDPLCPWCWITSRWIEEVSANRDLDLRWQPFSLALKNDSTSENARWGLQGLRIIEHARVEAGPPVVGPLYAEMGARVHNDGERFPEFADVLSAVGLDTSLADAAQDQRWDSVIREAMDAALELSGDDVGVPTIVYESRTAFFGPVMSPAPTGDEALRLWDSLADLATTTDGFFELKRTREVGPIFGERPRVAEVGGIAS